MPDKVDMTDEQERKLENILEVDYLDWEDSYALEYKIMPAMQELFRIAGEDPEKEGMEETPFRFIKAMLENTAGYRTAPKEHLRKTFNVDHKELVLVKDIEFNSMCEHHLAPFYGVAHIGYIPNEKITGLSKLARMLDGYAQRFQVQERLTSQVADAIQEVLDPQGVMVVIEAKHMCMCSRGVKKATANTTTSAVRGVFEEQAATRAEFLTLIK